MVNAYKPATLAGKQAENFKVPDVEYMFLYQTADQVDTLPENFVLTGIHLTCQGAADAYIRVYFSNNSNYVAALLSSAGQSANAFIPIPKWNLKKGLRIGCNKPAGSTALVSFIGYRDFS